MLGISDVKVRSTVSYNNEPYQVIKAEHHKMGRGGAVLKLKLRNLINGAVIDKTMQGNEQLEPADLNTASATYLYNDGTNYTFMNTETYDQFDLPSNALGESTGFMKENEDVEILEYNGKPVSVQLPLKVNLEVEDCPPGVKGDTANGGTKEATLETGIKVQVPLFIVPGEVIRVNTETGEYVERA